MRYAAIIEKMQNNYCAYSLPTQEIDICDSPFTTNYPPFTPSPDV